MLPYRRSVRRVGDLVKRKRETEIIIQHLQNAGMELNNLMVSAVNAGLKQIRREKFAERKKPRKAGNE